MAVATASLVAAAGLSCGGDSFDTFVDSYTSAACKRVFACCAPADVKLATTGTDEASCVAMGRARLHGEVAESIAMGLIRYDPAAGQKCLADLQQACPAVFNPTFGRLAVCGDLFPGAMPLGAACGSSECAVGLTCATGATCATPLPDGQPCSSSIDCAHTCTTNSAGTPTGVCRPGIC